jgi:hypothetical protein
MIKISLYWATLFAAALHFSGCASNKRSEAAQYDEEEEAAKCAKLSKYSNEQLENLFPFKDANYIKIVSFKQPFDDSISENEYIESRVIGNFYSKDSDGFMKIDSSRLNVLEWLEIATLSDSSSIQLANILFNYGFKGQPAVLTTAACYIPRNAVLFFNSANQAFAAIEICFECDRVEFYPKNAEYGQMCTEKMELLNSFFVDNGIKYRAARR